MSFVQGYDYFSDVDYADYRELICFERPISVLLHYEYGIEFTRIFLYDRFDFEWDGTELINKSNSLDDFYKYTDAVRYLSAKIFNFDDFKAFLERNLTASNEALLLPYYSLFGDVQISSTVMVEKINKTYFTTSLRGDHFYIRKPLDIEAFFQTLYLDESVLEYWKFNITDQFLFQQDLSLAQAIDLYSIPEKFKTKIHSFKTNVDSIKGANALIHAFHELKKDYSWWESLVLEGMSNALMVKFFWPIQFFYKPFLVFLNFIERNSCLEIIQKDEEKRLLLAKHIHEIDGQTKKLNNLAILFGKKPSERRFNEFQKIFYEILLSYSRIEEMLYE